jgi:hypothetical protein
MLFTLGSCQENNVSKPNVLSIENQDTILGYSVNAPQVEDGSNEVDNGLHKSYHKSGSLAEVGVLIDGKKNGVWKIYDDSGLLIQVEHFYNDKATYELDKKDFLFSWFEIDERMKLKLPSTWEVSLDLEVPLLVTGVKNCESDSITFCPNITVTKETLPEDIEFEYYVQVSMERFSESLPVFKIIKGGSTEINGLPAFQYSYLMVVDEVRLGGIATIVLVDNEVYNITGTALNSKKHSFLLNKGLFQEISGSLDRL